jgi:hypothetical protein
LSGAVPAHYDDHSGSVDGHATYCFGPRCWRRCAPCLGHSRSRRAALLPSRHAPADTCRFHLHGTSKRRDGAPVWQKPSRRSRTRFNFTRHNSRRRPSPVTDGAKCGFKHLEFRSFEPPLGWPFCLLGSLRAVVRRVLETIEFKSESLPISCALGPWHSVSKRILDPLGRLEETSFTRLSVVMNFLHVRLFLPSIAG